MSKDIPVPSEEPSTSAALTNQDTPDGKPLTRRALREQQAAQGRTAKEAASHAPTERIDIPTIPQASVPVTAAEPAPTMSASQDADEEVPEYLGSKPRRARSNFRGISGKAMSFGAVAMAGLLVAGMSMTGLGAGRSTTDVAAATQAQSTKKADKIQAYVVPSDVTDASVERSVDYRTVTAAQVAQETGIRYTDSVFTNDPTSAVQWPFVVGTGMSYGYGMRDGRMHDGVDFTPGEGAPIQAIADGVVVEATENGGGYGVNVYIEHVIDGKKITSHYAHMQHGSLKVVTGQRVKVGDIVGATGNTGHSFGAHLHFELLVDGHTIDPMPWLKEHAG